MNTIVIKHVAYDELPAAWRTEFNIAKNTRVTVHIEEEKEVVEDCAFPALTGNPLFGVWQNREETVDVTAYARKLRAPRYKADGSREN